MESRLLPRVVTTITSIFTRYLIPNQDQDVTYLVPVVVISLASCVISRSDNMTPADLAVQVCPGQGKSSNYGGRRGLREE
ncbi:hypothetical protein PILCRDRAFT_816639 [Piloderma croceum F 1598]|uniref:Uncharacterized protein n=1 Tax=Piloderma croceum (strain F 1598) TaxID=765440 RepID=A0A0C3G649_PILCF|nr:hypothetical protein PILCRDRAFT_816639 [Piloderma croceum F 1598]